MSELDTVQFNEDSSEGDDLNEMKHLNVLANLKMKNVQYSSADVLLEALIHQICRYVETDTAKQKRLFIVICDKLHELRLLGKSYKLEELQGLREKYMSILQKLILAAKCLVDIDVPNQQCREREIPLDTQIQSLRGKLFDWSRYAHEFREMDFIARGGFGQVYKAHNILDDCDYAVKKISLKYHKIDSFVQSLREVQTLARLNHPNIVAYKAAWLEPFDSRKHNVIQTRSKPRIQEIKPRLPVPQLQGIGDIPFKRLHVIEEPKSDSKQTSNSFEIEFKDSSVSDSVVDFRYSDSTHHKSETSHKQIETKNHETEVSYHGKKSLLIDDVLDSPDTSSSSHMSRPDNKSELDKELCPLNVHHMSEVGTQHEIKNCLSNGYYDRSEASSPSNAKVSPGHVKHEEIVPVRQMRSRFTSAMQEVHDMNYFFPVSQTVSMDWVTLYIQMQLCQLTLKEWLSCAVCDNINSASSPYDRQVMYIFKQIVQGLDYIHAQGIVHHDIKPSNIFVSRDLKSVQVGDFGLACCLLPHSPHEGGYSVISAPPRSEHPLGTRLYAAPEQLHGLCDPKSDVYSLGIVLFEMLINFSTDMEKSKEITRLKMGHMPPRIASQYPHYAKIITKLLDVNPKHRPTASQILMYLESCPDLRSRFSSGSSLEEENRLSTDSKVEDMDNVYSQRRLSDSEISKKRPSDSKSSTRKQSDSDNYKRRPSDSEEKVAVIEELKLELSRKKDEIEELQDRINQLESGES